MTEKEIPVNLPATGAGPMDGDPMAMYNARCWLQRALEAKGAKITGAGVGGECADLDFTFEGCKFNVVIRAR